MYLYIFPGHQRGIGFLWRTVMHLFFCENAVHGLVCVRACSQSWMEIGDAVIWHCLQKHQREWNSNYQHWTGMCVCSHCSKSSRYIAVLIIKLSRIWWVAMETHWILLHNWWHQTVVHLTTDTDQVWSAAHFSPTHNSANNSDQVGEHLSFKNNTTQAHENTEIDSQVQKKEKKVSVKNF